VHAIEALFWGWLRIGEQNQHVRRGFSVDFGPHGEIFGRFEGIDLSRLTFGDQPDTIRYDSTVPWSLIGVGFPR